LQPANEGLRVSENDLPDWNDVDAAAHALGLASTPAELHGGLCGWLAAGGGDVRDWPARVLADDGLPAPKAGDALDRLRPVADDVRMKPAGAYMHLKSYAVDGRLLRSGSANLSASGLKQQDNDLVVLHDPSAAKSFEARFQQLWNVSRPLPNSAAYAEPASEGAPTPAKDCAIKGNVNRKGEKIFHVPGSRDYARVTITGAEERMFCSEAEATAAGWRPAAGK
jgi:phosphatidylserine/phosphatidylglycerophosphate/cardiolipin synthase-like enzyme